MEYLQQFIDLHRLDIEPESFVIALALRYVHRLINHGGSDCGRPDMDSALHPQHLEVFLSHAVEIAWKDKRFAREWRRLQQALPRVRSAWEKGQTLFHEGLERAKSDQEVMEYFSMIDFAVDCYAEVSSSRAYHDSSALRDWSINGYMLMWRRYFLDDVREREQRENSDA